MTFKYPIHVNSNAIKLKRDRKTINGVLYRRRYYLNIPLNYVNITNCIVVILKNPSKANKKKSDLTINRVIEYISRHKKLNRNGLIVIVNLFALYRTDSKEIKEIINNTSEQFVVGNECSSQNDAAIIDAIGKAQSILLAWGGHARGLKQLHDLRVQTILSNIYSKQNEKNLYYVKSVSKKANPRHAQVWGYKDELISCSIAKDKNQKFIINRM